MKTVLYFEFGHIYQIRPLVEIDEVMVFPTEFFECWFIVPYAITFDNNLPVSSLSLDIRSILKERSCSYNLSGFLTIKKGDKAEKNLYIKYRYVVYDFFFHKKETFK